MSGLWKQLGLLAIIIIVFILWIFGEPAQPASAPATQQTDVPTPPSAAVLQQLKDSPSFQYLVSYTGKGFEPSTLTVKSGDTVRFTNNSSGNLWVASIGAGADQIYPGTSQCGGSDFVHARRSLPATSGSSHSPKPARGSSKTTSTKQRLVLSR